LITLIFGEAYKRVGKISHSSGTTVVYRFLFIQRFTHSINGWETHIHTYLEVTCRVTRPCECFRMLSHS